MPKNGLDFFYKPGKNFIKILQKINYLEIVLNGFLPVKYIYFTEKTAV